MKSGKFSVWLMINDIIKMSGSLRIDWCSEFYVHAFEFQHVVNMINAYWSRIFLSTVSNANFPVIWILFWHIKSITSNFLPSITEFHNHKYYDRYFVTKAIHLTVSRTWCRQNSLLSFFRMVWSQSMLKSWRIWLVSMDFVIKILINKTQCVIFELNQSVSW